MKKYLSYILIYMLLTLTACNNTSIEIANTSYVENISNDSTIFVKNNIEIPEYDGNPSVIINNNVPFFKQSDITTEPFEIYSDLDSLDRCGVVFANICKDIMPTEERGKIGHIKPSGWHTIKYNDIIDGNYLYNRCHLIGYQLSGENDNIKNLITGTRYLNIEGMLPYENIVADYVKNTNNHVLYRVTPIFEKNNLVANGVTIEAYSVEDNGKGICFNVYCYNVQPNITIDYASGNSKLNEKILLDDNENQFQYVLNTKSKKIHNKNCSSIFDMNEKNKEYTTKTMTELLEDGYTPCQNCN